MVEILIGVVLRRIDISLLETGRHPKTASTTSLCTRNPTQYSCLSSFPRKETLCPSSVDISPKHLAEPQYVPVISAHCMSQLFKFPSWPQSSHIPCSNRNVLPTSNFLDLWYTSGILVTYIPVSNSRRCYCYPGL